MGLSCDKDNNWISRGKISATLLCAWAVVLLIFWMTYFHPISRSSKPLAWLRNLECTVFLTRVFTGYFHFSTKGEAGARCWSHFWLSYAQLLQQAVLVSVFGAFWWESRKCCKLHACFNQFHPNWGASLGDSLARMLLSLLSWVYAHPWSLGWFIHGLTISIQALCLKIHASQGSI